MADVPPIAAMAGGTRPTGAVLDLWKFDASRFRINHLLEPDLKHPWCHNHPWDFCWGLILNGGYTHEYHDVEDGAATELRQQSFKPGDVNFMLNNRYHRIVSLEPNTYTLFFWGPDNDRGAGLKYWINGRGAVPWAKL